jgi:pimeloyl-ACP methyl ester carboxylesterase
MNYDANWIPEAVQTLIVGAEFDAITSYSLFNNDKRFDRKNIEKTFISGAGHLPWIEKPDEVFNIFHKFIKKLSK